MALELGRYVLRGEIDNTRPNQLHGTLALRGLRSPLSLTLSGNPAPELSGRHVVFEVRGPESSASPFPWHGIARPQIGAPGRVFLRRVRAGRRPPHELLTLEWFSQNGRLVIELVNPRLDVIAGPPLSRDVVPETDLSLVMEQLARDAVARGELSAASSTREPSWRPALDSLRSRFEPVGTGGDSWLIPAVDALLGLDLLDRWVEGGQREIRLRQLIEAPERLPPEAELTDAEVERAVQVLLSSLATQFVAVDLCEHATARRIYRWLDGHVLDGTAHPELWRTGQVTHLSTSQHCSDCVAEFEPGTFSGV